MDLNDIKSAIDESTTAFERFKKTQASQVSELQATVRDLEAKLGRPNLSSAGAGFGPDSRECKAFRSFVKTGSEAELKALDISAGPEGGFAVPKEIDQQIDSLALQMSPVRQLASVIRISTSDYHKLVNLRGTGASWVSEQAARPSTNTPTLADIQPPMGELYANPQVTQQMLDDAFFSADQWLLNELAEQFTTTESSAFVNGTGVAQPRGFMTPTFAATADGTRAFGVVEYVPSGASGAFATNSVDVLLTAVSHMRVGYLDPLACGWGMNAKTFATMLEVKDLYGRSIVMPSFVQGGKPQLLGYPITILEHMSDIAANSYSIIFANWKRFFLIVDRVGTTVLRDPYSNKPYVGFYARKRVGSAIVNSEAAKVIKFATS